MSRLGKLLEKKFDVDSSWENSIIDILKKKGIEFEGGGQPGILFIDVPVVKHCVITFDKEGMIYLSDNDEEIDYKAGNLTEFTKLLDSIQGK